jgi:peptidyl-prolyl cis-trans isomerase C
MRHDLLIAGLAALASAFAAPVVVTAAEYDADPVLATVDDDEITLGHMIALKSRLPAPYREMPDGVLFPGILSQLIDQSLLAQEAETNGAANRRDIAALLDNERRGLLANTVLADLADQAVTEEAIQAAYARDAAGISRSQEYHASHILVATREEAQAVRAKLDGGADFAALAREQSTGPTRANGGSLGWFEAGEMVPAFAEAVQALELGSLAGPIETQFGWHVIKLNEKRMTPLPTLEELRPGLEQQLRHEALNAHMSALRERAEIARHATDMPASALSDVELTDN